MAIPEGSRLPNRASGLTRVIRAAGYSWSGLKAAFQSEAAFRQELGLVAILTPCIFLLPAAVSLEYRMLLGVGLAFILVTELLNSAVEAIVDKTTPEFHELAKQAKDMGSAAVFISLWSNGILWAGALWLAFGRQH